MRPFNAPHMRTQHAHLSDRDLLLIIIHNQGEIMGALEDALAAEDVVIAKIVELIQSLNATDLRAQLDAANVALANLQVQDDADKAALQAALDEIQVAADSVTADTAALQALVPAPTDGV